MFASQQVESVTVTGAGLDGHPWQVIIETKDSGDSTTRLWLSVDLLRSLIQQGVKVIGETQRAIEDVTDKLMIVMQEDGA